MSVNALLAELNELGVVLWAESGRVRFRPLKAVPPELLEAMRAQRAELLAELEADRDQFPIVHSRLLYRSDSGVEVLESRQVSPSGRTHWEKRLRRGAVGLVGGVTDDPAEAALWVASLQPRRGKAEGDG